MAGADKIDVPDTTSREALAWVERLKSGRMTLADRDALRRWQRQNPAHAQALAEATVLMRLVAEASEGLTETDAPIATAYSRPAALERRYFLGGLAAASAAAVGYLSIYPPLALWPSLTEIAANLGADYTTGTGERRNIEIARVAVEMNTQTGIAVLSQQPAAGVQLIHGEAAIETRGVPFLVKAGVGRTLARDAKLNVRYDGTSACITCEAGALRLMHPQGNVGLAAGQQIVYSSGEIGKVAPTDIAVATAWRRGMLIFHNETLSYVVAQVNRYRKGRIVILKDSLAQQRVYANFHLDKVDTIVDQVQHFSHAQAFSVGDVVFLS